MVGKMFPFINETWNAVAMRCLYDCYNHGCWASKLKDGKLRETPRYRDLSAPHLIESELHRSFKDGNYVFVEDMGDLFGPWIPGDWISRIFNVMKQYPQTRFLLMTKNPVRYVTLRDSLPTNAILGTTIETNRDTARYSKAPPTIERWGAMLKISWPHKFVSIEPIMDFDLKEFATALSMVPDLEMVAVGYDNYQNLLPEPELGKTRSLIARLKKFTYVIEKTMRESRWIDGTYHSE